ncbi:hypothetical protein ACFL1R_10365 [Candidatus Latescibacterota bacterium]
MFALRYLNTVEEKIVAVLDQTETIKKAAEMITRAVTGGNSVYLVDTQGIIDAEMVDRASGLVLFRSLKDSRQKLTEGDVLIISTYYPEDERDFNYLNEAHASGASVITISPSGKLSGNADVALVNNSDIQNGIYSAYGIDRPFCPVSGFVNAVMAWSLAAETAALLLAQGKTPTVYWGEYLVGGKEQRTEARRRFIANGY